MKSPFDELEIDRDLVCNFFAVFSRFEYAMKATRYCRSDRYRNAVPNWRLLREILGEPIELDLQGNAVVLVDYLISEPPQVQKYEQGSAIFRAVPLSGTRRGEWAIDAAKRVRNNLFHGGKHTPHSTAERDTRLILAALVVLDACLQADADLRAEFDRQIV